MNESRHTHMDKSRHTYHWVMAHININGSRYTSRSRGSSSKSMLIQESWHKHMNVSQHTYECVTAHIWMCHSTHTNVSQHTWMCHSTHTTESWHIYTWMCRGTPREGGLQLANQCLWTSHAHTYEWVTARQSLSHGTYTYECVGTHLKIEGLKQQINVTGIYLTASVWTRSMHLGVMAQINESYHTYVNESWHTHVNVSWHTYE